MKKKRRIRFKIEVKWNHEKVSKININEVKSLILLQAYAGTLQFRFSEVVAPSIIEAETWR